MIRELIERWKYRRSVRRLRSDLAFFGLLFPGMTEVEFEEHIKDCLLKAAPIIAQSGITAAEAARNLAEARRALAGEGYEPDSDS